jgi:hypothetical protein
VAGGVVVAGAVGGVAAQEASSAVAFSRCGDPVTGDFEDPIVLARFGEVDLSALGG